MEKSFVSDKSDEAEKSVVFADNADFTSTIEKTDSSDNTLEKSFPKEVTELSVQLIIQKTRKELYDEIWEMSVAGLAKKYDVPYAHMIKQIKEADIPIPASGYWTKLSHGKPVSVIELTGNPDETISIYRTAQGIQKRKVISPQVDENKSVSTEALRINSENFDDSDAGIITDAQHAEEQHEPEIRERYGQKCL